ncbi:MAG: hypothetical protein WCI00_09760 [bacterium]
MDDDHPLSKLVVRLRLLVPASTIFTHAVTPFENSTSLQLVVFAEAIEMNHQKSHIRPTLSKIFFIIGW